MEDLATGQDYEVLSKLIRGKRTAFEFGSFRGGSALAVLPELQKNGGRLYCIDHFRGNNDDPYTNIPRREMVDSFLARTEPYWDSLTVIIGSTKEALLFPQSYADMVFIDAGHSYKEVLHDIQCAIHLVRRGGIICGHDYVRHYKDCDPEAMALYSETPDGGHDGVGYGVIRAVHESFGQPNHEAAVWWVEVV